MLLALPVPLALASLRHPIWSRLSSNLRISFDFRHCNVVVGVVSVSVSAVVCVACVACVACAAVAIVVDGDLPCYQCAMAKLTAINLIRFCFHLSLPLPPMAMHFSCCLLAIFPCLLPCFFFSFQRSARQHGAWGNNLRNWQVNHSEGLAMATKQKINE